MTKLYDEFWGAVKTPSVTFGDSSLKREPYICPAFFVG